MQRRTCNISVGSAERVVLLSTKVTMSNLVGAAWLQRLGLVEQEV